MLIDFIYYSNFDFVIIIASTCCHIWSGEVAILIRAHSTLSMDSAEESEYSSDSQSERDVEEEEEEEEEEDENEEEDVPSTAEKDGQGGGEGRKRKRKAVGHRRKLRTKYESVKDFNPEARSAQTEEIERIRRLELQRSLQIGASSAVARGNVTGRDEERGVREGGGMGEDELPVVLDLAEEEEEESVEAIVISSDSEGEAVGERGRRGEGVGRREVKPEPGSSVRLGRYDGGGVLEDGRVVVNVGHREEEEDLLLAPQIARIIKPHQVRIISNSRRFWG